MSKTVEGAANWHSCSVNSVRQIAAINNAEWCNAVCRAHGIDGETDERLWTSRTRTPLLYPDAVTLVPDPSLESLVVRIDASPGCSIKDSFATLNLAGLGFRVLFEAQWIVRTLAETRTIGADLGWDVVSDVDGFVQWELAWRGTNGPAGVLLPSLFSLPHVVFAAAKVGERVVAGAVFNRSAAAVGISNFFVEPSFRSECWEGCEELAATLFPGSLLVGYESGRALDVARERGFAAVGPLQVWIRDN